MTAAAVYLFFVNSSFLIGATSLFIFLIFLIFNFILFENRWRYQISITILSVLQRAIQYRCTLSNVDLVETLTQPRINFKFDYYKRIYRLHWLLRQVQSSVSIFLERSRASFEYRPSRIGTEHNNGCAGGGTSRVPIATATLVRGNFVYLRESLRHPQLRLRTRMNS